jgi:hypothetical protein
MAAFRIKLYSLEDEEASPDYIGLVKSLEDECFRDLRVHLEGVGIVEWPFDFWDIEEHSRIKRRAKGVSPIEHSVYVIPVSNSEIDRPSKHRRVQAPVKEPLSMSPVLNCCISMSYLFN